MRSNSCFKLFLGICLFAFLISCVKHTEFEVSNKNIRLQIIGNENEFLKLSEPQNSTNLVLKAPVFEIDGKTVVASLSEIRKISEPDTLRNKACEYVFEGTLVKMPDVTLKIIARIPESNPVIRFCYELRSTGKHYLTKKDSVDNLEYLSFILPQNFKSKEIRFSEFNEMVHSFSLSERNLEQKHFNDSVSVMGPIVMASSENSSLLIAYEHGSQVPDAFLQFKLKPTHEVSLKAVKSNYYRNEEISGKNSFQTIWFEATLIKGNEDSLAKTYRSFVLNDMTENLASRKPYIFYNTWNYQERMKHWYKKPYLDSMNLKRMTREIDAAHKMGIEVFVIDAGWFEKTGDWSPSPKRFPDGLKDIKKQLEGYGMKLGLWFNPTVAAVSSKMYLNHINCVRTINGDKGKPWPIWETEDSYGMCLVSGYKDAFADELIRLNKQLGVTYFKWDAIGQYECNDPGHFHGNENNTPKERLENYGFEIGRAMSYVVNKLAKACPEAIVDFDITEGGRTVGLGFLSAGKYFLINNGPYYFNYNIPFDMEHGQWNIFFFPGPARGWICRTPLSFDKWFPSVCFLTHYLPDDPIENQNICMGSLILGQNGIWGDLPAISGSGKEYFGKVLGYYKQVRYDMTQVALNRDGAVGGSPEVYEKLNPENGRGAIVLFSSHSGTYTYISKIKTDKQIWASEGATVSFTSEGFAKISAEFTNADAKIVFFGVK